MIHCEVRPGLVPENIFFIHGNLASNRWWLPAENVWESFARGKEFAGSLIYGEIPGCGKSTPPESLSAVDMNFLAQRFIAAIQGLGTGPVHVVGHSTGGLIAALMLAKEPDLFKRAVLVDPVGAEGISFDRSMITAFQKMKSDRDLTAAVIGSTIHNNNTEGKFFQEVIVEDAFQAVKSVGHWILEALDGLDVQGELASVKNPVLVLHGEHDKLLPKKDSESLARLFCHGRFEEIPDQGHCVNVENPELFVKIVRSFLFNDAV